MTASPRKTNEPLPPLLNEIADIIGREATLKFAAAFGGTRVLISTKDGSRLSSLLGDEPAAKLMKAFGGNRFDVPLGPHASQGNWLPRVAALRNMGLKPRKIALALKITERTVRRHFARLRSTETVQRIPRQGQEL